MSDKKLDIGGEFGDYRVVKLLGASGNVDVYLMRSTSTGQFFAMKIFLPPEGITDESRQRFSDAINEAMQIRNPNLVRVYDYGEDPDTGLFYLIMDYVTGGTLAEYIAANGPLDIEEALKTAILSAQTLESVHEVGRIHGDLKADNIMFEQDGTLKISDLGIASASTATMSAKAPEKNGGAISPYTAPEQVMHSTQVDSRADVYALGVALFEMLTGSRVAPTPTVLELIVKVTNKELMPDVRTLRPETPPVVAEAVARLCAPDAADRPRTGGEAAALLLDALEAIGGKIDAQEPATADGTGAKKKKKASGKKLVIRRSAVPVVHTSEPEERGGGVGRILAVLLILAVIVAGALVALLPGKFRIGGVVADNTKPADASQTVNDATIRSEVIDGNTWYYSIENSKAVLWRGQDEKNGKPCVEPEPVGRLVVPKTIGGLPVGALGNLAFCSCEKLTEIELPETLERFGNRAFIYCSSLESIILPAKVKSVGLWTFNRCTSLTRIDLANCEEIPNEGGILAFCTKLEEIHTSPDNPVYRAVDGVLYSADGKRLLAYPAKKSSDVVEIREGIEEIGEYAFCDSQARGISVPGSVQRLGQGAFENCHSLAKLIFAGNAPSLLPGEDSIFKGANRSLSVLVPKGREGWPAGRAKWPQDDGRKVEVNYVAVTREWRDVKGRTKQASLVGIAENGAVAIMQNPGEDKVRSLTISKLSEEDRRFISAVAPELREYVKRNGTYVPAE